MVSGVVFVRKIELDSGKLTLTENKIEGFIEKTITPFGNSAKADVPKKYIGRRAYIIIAKEK